MHSYRVLGKSQRATAFAWMAAVANKKGSYPCFSHLVICSEMLQSSVIPITWVTPRILSWWLQQGWQWGALLQPPWATAGQKCWLLTQLDCDLFLWGILWETWWTEIRSMEISGKETSKSVADEMTQMTPRTEKSLFFFNLDLWQEVLSLLKRTVFMNISYWRILGLKTPWYW